MNKEEVINILVDDGMNEDYADRLSFDSIIGHINQLESKIAELEIIIRDKSAFMEAMAKETK
jgi:hypothetical protein